MSMPGYVLPTAASEERQEWETGQFAQRIEHAPAPGVRTGLNFREEGPLLRDIPKTTRMEERRKMWRSAYAEEKESS